MNGFRSLCNAIAALLIFTLLLTAVGGLAKGVRAGSVDPKLLAAGVTGFALLAAAVLFAAVIRLFRRHRQHMEKASSADILADIIPMKDNEKKTDSEEEAPHE